MEEAMTKWFAVLLLLCGMAWAQDTPPQGQPPNPEGGPGPHRMMRGPGGPEGPGMGMGPRWWKESRIVQAIGLSDQQVQQIEQIFQQNMGQLHQYHQTLQAQEKQLHDLLNADQPNSSQVNAQIDQIVQTRGQLEKNNAQMHLAIRGVLTADQWKKLQAEMETMHQQMRERMQYRERRPGDQYRERRNPGEPPAPPKPPQPEEPQN
jgi:Spy/CpxP family protein refolding chaperone